MAFLPILAVVASVAATAVSAMGSMQAGAQAKATANYNAQVDQVKATTAEMQSQSQATQDAANTQRQLGQAEAAYGAGGVDMTGTPLAVMSDLATQGECSAG